MGRHAMYHNPNHRQEFARARPLQPNYQDEVSQEQVAAIRTLVDPDGSREAKRKPLYNSGW